MSQVIQLIGRLSPKQKINLDQRGASKLQNDQDYKPLDIIPFSEIQDQRKQFYSIAPIQYEIRIPTRRSTVRSRSQRSQKSRNSEKSLFTSEKSSRCSKCELETRRAIRERYRVTPKRQPRTPSKSRMTPKRQATPKNQINESESQHVSAKQAHSISLKGCPYHAYTRQSQVSLPRSNRSKQPNPYLEEKFKLEQLHLKKRELMEQFSAKSLKPKVEPKVHEIAWRCDQRKIEEGKMRKTKLQEALVILKAHAEPSERKRSLSSNPQKLQEIKNRQLLEKRKSLMRSKPQKNRSKSEKKHLKKTINEIKKEKSQKLILQQIKEKQLKDLQEEQLKLRQQNKKAPFKPTEEEIEQAFT